MLRQLIRRSAGRDTTYLCLSLLISSLISAENEEPSMSVPFTSAGGDLVYLALRGEDNTTEVFSDFCRTHATDFGDDCEARLVNGVRAQCKITPSNCEGLSGVVWSDDFRSFGVRPRFAFMHSLFGSILLADPTVTVTTAPTYPLIISEGHEVQPYLRLLCKSWAHAHPGVSASTCVRDGLTYIRFLCGSPLLRGVCATLPLKDDDDEDSRCVTVSQLSGQVCELMQLGTAELDRDTEPTEPSCRALCCAAPSAGCDVYRFGGGECVGGRSTGACRDARPGEAPTAQTQLSRPHAAIAFELDTPAGPERAPLFLGACRRRTPRRATADPQRG